jgi:hypothetical protein
MQWLSIIYCKVNGLTENFLLTGTFRPVTTIVHVTHTLVSGRAQWVRSTETERRYQHEHALATGPDADAR